MVQQNDNKKYIARMMIVLISYYEYFIKGNECKVIIQLLQQPTFHQLLDIQGLEKSAFELLARGPIDTPDDIDILTYIFSKGKIII